MFDSFNLGNVCVLASVLFILLQWHLSGRGRTLPPGPRGWPIVGNLFDVPTVHQWLTFSSWGDKWGGIVSLRIITQHVIILNSLEHAVNLLDQRSAIYSDRPPLVLAGEIVGWDKLLGIMRYGNTFRAVRRLIHQVIGTRSDAAKFAPRVETETTRFLLRLLRRPEDILGNIRKVTAATILMVSYGYPVQEEEDLFVNLADSGMGEFSMLTTPGAFLVDSFPLFKYIPSWLPLGSWKRNVPSWRQTVHDVSHIPHEFVKRQMASGTAVASFTSNLLDSSVDAEREDLIMNTISSMYLGGADTTVSALYSFFLAMVCHPEAQTKAQLEIDGVVGHDRLPTAADIANLPYVNAIYLETLRWNPLGPLGLPHRVMEDDVYEGYFIPKGSIVIANMWRFLHDPEVHARPMDFDPDRFISPKIREAERDPRDIVFGFGRRKCPGMHLADLSMVLNIAKTLAVFDIKRAVDKGEVVEPVVEYTSNTISHPKPFRCSLQPRSVKAESLIISAADEVNAKSSVGGS